MHYLSEDCTVFASAVHWDDAVAGSKMPLFREEKQMWQMYLTFNGSHSVLIPREQKADAAHAQGILQSKGSSLYWIVYVIKK